MPLASDGPQVFTLKMLKKADLKKKAQTVNLYWPKQLFRSKLEHLKEEMERLCLVWLIQHCRVFEGVRKWQVKKLTRLTLANTPRKPRKFLDLLAAMMGGICFALFIFTLPWLNVKVLWYARETFVGKFPAFDGASNQKFNGRCAASNSPLQNCPIQFELPRFDPFFFSYDGLKKVAGKVM